YDAEGLPIFGLPGDPLPVGATINPRSDGAVAGNTNGRNTGNNPVTANRANSPTSASSNDPQVIGYDAEGLPVFGTPGTQGSTASLGSNNRVSQPYSSGSTEIVGRDSEGGNIYQTPSGRRYTQEESEALFKEQNSLSASNPAGLAAAVQVPAARATGAYMLADEDGFYPIVVNGESPDGVFFEEIPYGEDSRSYVANYGTVDRAIPNRTGGLANLNDTPDPIGADGLRNENNFQSTFLNNESESPIASVNTQAQQANSPAKSPASTGSNSSAESVPVWSSSADGFGDDEFIPLLPTETQTDEQGNIILGTLEAINTRPSERVGGIIDGGHYVIVASLDNETNAKEQANQMLQNGYPAEYKYHPGKSRYYVYLFKSPELNKARIERDRLRQIELFKDAWILTVE
ncbi:MAG TPA: hypothetical protein DCR93_27505, partial [Cytophagales bacterium]|nr:hypothetical protein [Cytophagales bacterium]